jgi:GntR family transcriptional regulator/MocR family aminotransferase
VLRAEGARTVAVEGAGSSATAKPRPRLALVSVRCPLMGAARCSVKSAMPTHGCSLPAHQFPLGVVLAPELCAEAVRWVRAREVMVIEDDYDGEIRFDRHPTGALQALAPDQSSLPVPQARASPLDFALGRLAVPPVSSMA